MTTPPTAKNGVKAASDVARLVRSATTPTKNGANADNARTIERMAAARPRSSPGTTSDVSASLGATGAVRQKLPKNINTAARPSECVSKPGSINAVAKIDVTAVTYTRA